MPDGYDPRQRPWYKQAVTADKTMLTPPYLAAVGGLVVTVALPVKHNGELLGVVGGDLSLETLVKNHQLRGLRWYRPCVPGQRRRSGNRQPG
nr:hypothetical protein GCM10020185_30110 [Pseudomonas brassicacearum subsp. brassicacearum]